MEDDLQLEEYDTTDTMAEDMGELDDSEDLLDDPDLVEMTQANMDVDFNDVEEEDPDDVGFEDVDDELLDEDDDVEIEEVDEDDEEEYEIETASLTARIKDKLQGIFAKKKKEELFDDEEDEEIEEDIDSDSTQDISFKDKMDKTLKTVVNQKLPMLGNLLNKNKNKETVALDSDGNKLDDLDLEEGDDIPQEKVGKKLKITPMHILIIAGLAIFLIDFGEEETKAPDVKPKKVVNKKPPVKIKKKPIIEDIKKGVEEIKKNIADSGTKTPLDGGADTTTKKEPVVEKIEKKPVEKDPEIAKIDPEVAKKIDDIENTNTNLDDLKTKDEPIKPVKDVPKVVDVPKKDEPPKIENITDTDLDSLDSGADSNVDAVPTDDIDLGDLDSIETPVDTSTNTASDTTIDETPMDIVDTSTSDEVVKIDDVMDMKPEEIIPQKELQPDASTEITKKLLQDLEVRLKEEKKVQKTMSVVKPTPAPSYEIAGLGLVYNCKDGHWACIEREEYGKCRQNYSWNKNEGIPLECYPVAFLKTEYDCAMVQQEKIDSVSDTDFCEM